MPIKMQNILELYRTMLLNSSFCSVPNLIAQALLIMDHSEHHEATFIDKTLPFHLTCDCMERTLFCAFTFARVLSNIYTKLNDVSRKDFTGRTLLRATAQPLAVDERPIAAFSVLQVELQAEKHSRLEFIISK